MSLESPPPDIAILEAHLAAQSGTKKQTHYFFTYVAWGMQISAAVVVGVLALTVGYFYYVFTTSSAAHGYGDWPPDEAIFLIQLLTEALVTWPLWTVVGLTSIYLLRTYGFRQICAYLGPMAICAALILQRYDALEAIEFWLAIL